MFSMFITMLKVYGLFKSGKLIYCVDMPHPEYLSFSWIKGPLETTLSMWFPRYSDRKGHD